ncbi:MAG: lipocalin-like domain-containing protein [Granulosicoccaceae bacterium]
MTQLQTIVSLMLALGIAVSAKAEQRAAVDISSALSGDASGFERALKPRPFSFPQDHGPHPSFRNEWWYLTGQLEDEQGRHHGFQYTLFRIALTPKPEPQALWPRESIWMAHAAVSHTDQQVLLHAQRLSHGGAASAGVRAAPFRVWLDNWILRSTTDTTFFPWNLSLSSKNFALELELQTEKPVVLQGDRGLSAKGGDGNASYYYSYTDLQVRGRLDGHAVKGQAWFDREWSTSVLPDGVAGWDWFSLQLSDGRQLMLFQLRSVEAKKTADSRSGTLIAPDGSSVQLHASDISMQALEHWRSQGSQASYPVVWRLDVKGIDQSFIVAATFPEQELLGIVNYWEGAVTVKGLDTNLPLGRGYLEMTGYAATRDAD